MAMSDETYNGWKNYPTWCVNMWIDNDEGLYNESCDLVRQARKRAAESDAYAEGIWTREQAERFTLADWIRTWVVDNLAPDLGASFSADLLGYALDQVDWDEIAAAKLAS